MSPAQRYVSKELTHFVGKNLVKDEERYSLLIKILKSGWLTHPPHNPNVCGNLKVNPAAKISANEMYVPQMVCFCDIPVGDLEIHMRKYGCFGLSFLKSFLAPKGANPVFYVAKKSTVRVFKDTTNPSELAKAKEALSSIGLEAFFNEVPRSDHFDEMMRQQHEFFIQAIRLQQQLTATDLNKVHALQYFLGFHIFSFMQFFDDEKPDDDPDNYYMEREWRMLGNLNFKLSDVCRVILPETYAKRLREDIPGYAGQIIFAEGCHDAPSD